MPKSKRYVDLHVLNSASGVLDSDNACFQFVVYNPTTLVIKLSQFNVLTDGYEFIVNANKCLVSPPLNFTQLNYIIDGFVPGRIRPTVYFYDRWIGSPGVSSIT